MNTLTLTENMESSALPEGWHGKDAAIAAADLGTRAMLPQRDETLEFRDDDQPGSGEDESAATGPLIGSPCPVQSRTEIVVEVDEVLGVVAEILELLKQRTSRGSQTGILIEGAAVATLRASKLTKRLLEE
jgi:hypothetical protein